MARGYRTGLDLFTSTRTRRIPQEIRDTLAHNRSDDNRTVMRLILIASATDDEGSSFASIKTIRAAGDLLRRPPLARDVVQLRLLRDREMDASAPYQGGAA